jgi:hypothetical protein
MTATVVFLVINALLALWMGAIARNEYKEWKVYKTCLSMYSRSPDSLTSIEYHLLSRVADKSNTLFIMFLLFVIMNSANAINYAVKLVLIIGGK